LEFHWVLIAAPHPRFPVQSHILSVGGDALTTYVNSFLLHFPLHTKRTAAVEEEEEQHQQEDEHLL